MLRNAIIMMLLVTSSCSLGGSEIRPLYPAFLPPPPEGGPAEFQQGWRDGCDTGLAQHGTDIYRGAFNFKQDPSQVLNPVYYKAWKDAENYCRTYIYEYSVRSLDVFCTISGIQGDCGGPNDPKSVPFLGGSSSGIGYNVIAGTAPGADGERFLGSSDEGIGGIGPMMGVGDGADRFWGAVPEYTVKGENSAKVVFFVGPALAAFQILKDVLGVFDEGDSIEEIIE